MPKIDQIRVTFTYRNHFYRVFRPKKDKKDKNTITYENWQIFSCQFLPKGPFVTSYMQKKEGKIQNWLFIPFETVFRELFG